MQLIREIGKWGLRFIITVAASKQTDAPNCNISLIAAIRASQPLVATGEENDLGSMAAMAERMPTGPLVILRAV